MNERPKTVHVLDSGVRIAIAVNNLEFETELMTGDVVDYRGMMYIVYDIVRLTKGWPKRFEGDVFIILERE